MDRLEKETWKNASRGRVAVLKYNNKGDLEHELVRSGGRVILTPDERFVNQERAVSDEVDVFKNGFLVPVKLVDGNEDNVEIASNPNLKTEEELRDLFKLQWKKFEAAIEDISNVNTLERLRDIAQEGDATVRQVNVIEARIVAVDPSKSVPDVTLARYSN